MRAKQGKCCYDGHYDEMPIDWVRSGQMRIQNFGPLSGHKDLEPNTFLSSPLTKSVHISLLIERGLIKAREEEKPVVGGMDRDAQWKIRIEPLQKTSLGIAHALFDS